MPEQRESSAPCRLIGPLHGLTVLDLSSVILGPMAGQYLGDMGADVIKIEAPEGDVTRSIGPRRHEGMGALFLANNRNKRSVVLDLKTEAGRSASARWPLAATCCCTRSAPGGRSGSGSATRRCRRPTRA